MADKIGPRQSGRPVLIVDDEASVLESFELILRSGGVRNAIRCQDSRDVMAVLDEEEVSVVLLDLVMPHVSGEALLKDIAQRHPEVPVIVVTGVNELRVAVDCMKAGAYDYIVKPPEQGELLATVRRAIETASLRTENLALRECVFSDTVKRPEAFAQIITNDAGMQPLFRYVEAVAGTEEPILITGETGVGKELIARAIHSLSRPDGPFVAVNAAGLDDNMFSDTLFGHVKGAFSGAEGHRAGLIKGASGGTLFLDEIGDLGTMAQVKLLRLVQEGEYFSLGSDVPLLSDARILAATNRPLDTLMEAGTFRNDLYYRFQTHRIHVPPLRERLQDLPLLVGHFLETACEKLGKKRPVLNAGLLATLSAYDFPGNVRELEALVFDAVSRHRSGALSINPFRNRPKAERPKMPASSPDTRAGEGGPFAALEKLPSLKEAADLLVDEALRRSKGNQSLAAQLLGVSRAAVSQRLRKRQSSD